MTASTPSEPPADAPAMASMWPDSTGDSHELSRSRAPIAAGSVSTPPSPTIPASSTDSVIAWSVRESVPAPRAAAWSFPLLFACAHGPLGPGASPVCTGIAHLARPLAPGRVLPHGG